MSLKEWIEAIISLVGVIFSWPLLGVIFIFLFRSQIAALILGIRRFGREGFEIAPQSERAGPVATSPTASAITPEEDSMRVADSPVLRDLEETIRADIRTRGLENSPNLVNILVRHLAVTRLVFSFEIIYSQIWGSQIAIMLYLNSLPPGAQISAVRPFYDNAARTFTQAFAAYPFDNYIRFLESWSLIRREGDRITITPFGREFLAHITRTGKSLAKPQ